MHFEVAHTACTHTRLTCNCLLRAHAGDASSAPHGPTRSEDSQSAVYAFHAASYELLPSSNSPAAQSEGVGVPHHIGECATYSCVASGCSHGAAPARHRCTSDGSLPPMPGVFDLISVPSRFFQPNRASTDALHWLMMACTDGSVRLLDPRTLASAAAPFTGIHEEMITSCTPLYAGGASSAAAAHLLCSAHTGAVVLYAVEERRVAQHLEGHEFDAWCTAVLPVGGRWAAPESHPGSDGEGCAETRGDAATCAVLLASGGDDGLCKLYDMRCNCRRAAGRLRFDAGVVSITPVLDTSSSAAAALPTPYLLVGSYDESIALVDMRSMRRPVAQRGGLGGGVWRTSRCLRPLWPEGAPSASPATECRSANLELMVSAASVDPTSASGVSSLHSSFTSCGWVNVSNVLVLPLMQRGAALLPYDVHASSDDVFGKAPLDYFFTEEGASADAGSLPALTDQTLVYDTAVLQPLTRSNQTAVVATASFYEKRIDVWSVRLARES
ncbi:hypothetical protein ABL78_6822 [Leptomonas seymouri]|uniref:Uncharacterized protein n=1 Tax=Leptomonas seymouri TaxID=5684 RepID=A0A0N1IHU3_LEPSE|nr:hypothetical protein ABL78_6822 [Leptomonas seymouri]|eukprot:KPI84124.1 hypothetical protein ABL78_6822 [Leptomonas seymouri]